MKSCRTLIAACLALALAGMFLLPASAHAQEYPSKSIKLIVPFPAGGATDIVSRVIAQQLGTELGQSVVVDNRAGAAGVIGSEAGARAAPDGYTLLLTTSSTHSIGPLLNPKISYSPIKDFTPILYLAESPQVVVVPPNSPINSIPELIAFAKANPGKLNFGSAGTGGIPHLSAERFQAMTGIRMTHVPYKGTALAMPDLMAGRLDVMFDSISTALPHIRDGKVRALAVTTRERSSVAPELPPLSQFVPGYESLTWFGVFGPAGLPQPIVDKVNAALNRALRNPEVLLQLAKLGFDPGGGTPEDFRKKMAAESAMWKRVIEDGKITLE